ncbi:HDOD domain-containing protein [Colwellia sp. MEBiC06753]
MNAVDYAKQANEIFVLSDSFLRIKELIDDETSTIDNIAEVILIDPALAATILKLANSSFFNYPGKIDTISKAVLVLGITEVYNLVIAYFTSEAFKSLNADASYLEQYWENSVDSALLIKYFGEQANVPNAERLFILGLLHNLGELVIKQFNPEMIDKCVSNSANEMPWDKQRKVLGFSYGDCTAELLKLWRLPISLIEPMRLQDSDVIFECAKEAQMLYIAKRVMLKNACFQKDPLEKFISSEEREQLGITDDMVKSAINYCNMERLGVLSILKPSALMIF